MKTIELIVKAEEYMTYLRQEEKTEATRAQYLREIQAFLAWVEQENGENAEVKKEQVICYKEHLQEAYRPATVNTKLAALNSFFAWLGRLELRVKPLKIQRKVYAGKSEELTYEDYQNLVETAEKNGDTRLSLIIQSICATGIRVSELRFITVEAVQRGEALIQLKGKSRTVLLPGKLRTALRKFAKKHHIKSGPIFVTKTGKPLNRSNIWRMMKNLCEAAGVNPKKVFPHNLRHLFARRFYDFTHDIAKLADVLGHSCIETTRIYIVTTCSAHRKTLDSLGLVLV